MKWKIISAIVILAIGFGLGYKAVTFFSKYEKETQMLISIKEILPLEYPNNPANLSTFYQRYGDRSLILTQKDSTHFDFSFESPHSYVAEINLKDIDLSIFMPVLSSWVKDHRSLEAITLYNRAWSDQFVSFPATDFSIEGGDGYEKKHLVSIEIGENSLGAARWEIRLYTEENDEKALFYQGWFQFPLGQYKSLYSHLNDKSYWFALPRLEYGMSPNGRSVDLEALRKVEQQEKSIFVQFRDERIIAQQEQKQRLRNFNAKETIYWKDFSLKPKNIEFAKFISPGIFSMAKKEGNEYQKIANLNSVVVRKVLSPAQENLLDEVEMDFDGFRLIASGIDFASLPQLDLKDYPEGLYMPLGIAVAPFIEASRELHEHPPAKSPYFALLLDQKNRWLDHRKIAIDGLVMFRDQSDPHTIHFYLLSYERISLVSHIAFRYSQLVKE